MCNEIIKPSDRFGRLYSRIAWKSQINIESGRGVPVNGEKGGDSATGRISTVSEF